MKKPTIVFDIDDVILDMLGAIKAPLPALEDGCFVNYNEIRVNNRSIQSSTILREMRIKDAWKTLLTTDSFEFSKNFIQNLFKKYRIIFSTNRQMWGKEEYVKNVTLENLNMHFQHLYIRIRKNQIRLNLSGEKLKGINNVIALVDDRVENLLPYIDTKIKLFLVTKPWNKNITNDKFIRIELLRDMEKYL
jgi:5'(3')-deoxyribonucleotidase